MTPISSSTEAPGSSPLRVRPFRRVVDRVDGQRVRLHVSERSRSRSLYTSGRAARLRPRDCFCRSGFCPRSSLPRCLRASRHLPARRILPLLYVAECAIAIALAFFARHFSLPAVLVLGSIDGALAIAAAALTRGINAALLGTGDLLRRGYAALNVSLSIADTHRPGACGRVDQRSRRRGVPAAGCGCYSC